MPKHRGKQRWNNWNPGFQRNNQQNYYNSPQNFQPNTSQNFNNSYFNQTNFPPNATYFYVNSGYQTNYTHDYRNNYFEPSLQRNFTQNRSHRNFSQNHQRNFTHTTRNADSTQPNFQRNVTQNYSNSDNELVLSNIRENKVQNVSTKNSEENSTKSNTALNTPKKGIIKKEEQYYKKTEAYNEKGYIIKETLYRDPSLFYAHKDSNTDQFSNDESINNWTDKFWQKQDDMCVPEVSRTSQPTKTVPRKNQNSLERTLNNMLAKPAEMSKGKSLLLKMGWQGGGLGRDGDGITEPIAPKATYAVKTIGLGHLTEKPPTKPKSFALLTNKKLKHPEFQNNFYANVLLYILEFVKNDEQNKIAFEPRLRKLERKKIHVIVEKLRECDNLDDFENFDAFSDTHLELVKQIWVHNCYELWTESEGERRNRQLCLFKEAPAHVYLITPEDLTENDESNDTDDKNENDDDISDNIKEEKGSDYIDSDSDSGSDRQNDQGSKNFKNLRKKGKISANTINCRKNCNSNQYLKEEFKNDCNKNIKKDTSNSVDSRVNMDINMAEDSQIVDENENNTLEMTQKNENIEFCEEIQPKIDVIIIDDETDSESTEMPTNTESTNKINPNDRIDKIMEDNLPVKVKNENISDITHVNNCNNIKVEEINEQNTQVAENMPEKITNVNIKPKIEEINEHNTKIVEKMSEKATNIKIHNDIKPKTENDEQTCSDHPNSSSQDDQKDEDGSILAKITKYFKEFSNDETFKEFRFLGPFDDEQIMHINAFFDICMKQDEIECCEEKNELLAAFDNELIKFEVLEDNNGKRFIKKVEENPQSPCEDVDLCQNPEEEEEEVIYVSSLYV